MAERREEEEGEEGARRWSSGGSYRPRSSWAREVVSGGGRFGPGRLDGERAEEVPRGGQVTLRGFPGSIWPRARGGRSPPAAYGGRRETEHRGEREMKVRAYL